MAERRYQAGMPVDDLCRACKTMRRHTVVAADGAGVPMRVVCDFCGSTHNYRGGGAERGRMAGAGMSGAGAASRGGIGSGGGGVSGGSRIGGAAAARSGSGDAGAMPLVSERERSLPRMSSDIESDDLEMLLRRVMRDELGLTPVVPADKWRGGDLVLRPGKPGLQEKSWPIETFFSKIVMLRNRLRVLEQQINAQDELPADAKLKLQGYITACYGSLTSFNILFAREDDRFKGSGSDD